MDKKAFQLEHQCLPGFEVPDSGRFVQQGWKEGPDDAEDDQQRSSHFGGADQGSVEIVFDNNRQNRGKHAEQHRLADRHVFEGVGVGDPSQERSEERGKGKHAPLGIAKPGKLIPDLLKS